MSGSERRRFFRIEDDVSISYELVDLQNEQLQVSNLEDQKHIFTLMAELQKVDNDLSATYHRLKQKSYDLASYLEGINKKIQMLGAIVLTCHTDIPSKPTHKVNVSAGGLAFNNPTALKVGQELLIKVVFYPSFFGLLTKAKVIDCRKGAQIKGICQFDIGIEFNNLDESDRDALMQLILRKQSEQLKAERETREEKSA